MVELADTLALGASAARHAGSSPVPGTIFPQRHPTGIKSKATAPPDDNLNFRSLYLPEQSEDLLFLNYLTPLSVAPPRATSPSSSTLFTTFN
jgi:hypothetical protein